MAHTYNASTGRLRQGGLQVQGQPKLLSEAVSENQQKKSLGSLGEEGLMIPSKEWEEGLMASSQ